MVTGKHKSSTMRKIAVKVPGNKVKIQYRLKKPGKATCPEYGTPLAGVPRGNTKKLQSIPKTQRRPERPFGGVLSSKAMRDRMKAKAREL